MRGKEKSITIAELTELVKEGCDVTFLDEARQMGFHPGSDPASSAERTKVFEYHRGRRHGMDQLLEAARRKAK